jgi:hypothetical protein
MPDFFYPSQEDKVAHLIVVNKARQCGIRGGDPEEKARFWVKIRDKEKLIINNYRSNTANTQQLVC